MTDVLTEPGDLDDVIDGDVAPEDDVVDGDVEPTGQKSRAKKFILLAIVGLVVLAGVGVGVYFSGLFGDSSMPGTATAAKGEDAPPPPLALHYLDLEEMVVTLGGAGRKSSFIKMRLSLELENASDEARIQSVMPRIIDNFQVFLRELRIEELQGSHGLYRVKEELLVRVNAAAHPAKVRDVLFREMLVQ